MRINYEYGSPALPWRWILNNHGEVVSGDIARFVLVGFIFSVYV